MAETLLTVGQSATAVSHYLRALELWRGVNDKRRVAFASYGLAVLFEEQGRLGAALNAKEDAMETVREVQDQIGLAQILGGYAAALDLLGRPAAAQKNLQEAL